MLKFCLYCFTANLSLAGLVSEQTQCLPNQKDADSLHIQHRAETNQDICWQMQFIPVTIGLYF